MRQLLLLILLIPLSVLSQTTHKFQLNGNWLILDSNLVLKRGQDTLYRLKYINDYLILNKDTILFDGGGSPDSLWVVQRHLYQLKSDTSSYDLSRSLASITYEQKITGGTAPQRFWNSLKQWAQVDFDSLLNKPTLHGDTLIMGGDTIVWVGSTGLVYGGDSTKYWANDSSWRQLPDMNSFDTTIYIYPIDTTTYDPGCTGAVIRLTTDSLYYIHTRTYHDTAICQGSAIPVPDSAFDVVNYIDSVCFSYHKYITGCKWVAIGTPDPFNWTRRGGYIYPTHYGDTAKVENLRVDQIAYMSRIIDPTMVITNSGNAYSVTVGILDMAGFGVNSGGYETGMYSWLGTNEANFIRYKSPTMTTHLDYVFDTTFHPFNHIGYLGNTAHKWSNAYFSTLPTITNPGYAVVQAGDGSLALAAVGTASPTVYTANYRMRLTGAAFNNISYWGTQDSLKTSFTGLILSTAGKLTSITNGSTNWNSGYTYRVTTASGTAPLTLTLASNGLTGSVALFSTTSTTKGVVNGSNNLGATYYLDATDTWSVPATATQYWQKNSQTLSPLTLTDRLAIGTIANTANVNRKLHIEGSMYLKDTIWFPSGTWITDIGTHLKTNYGWTMSDLKLISPVLQDTSNYILSWNSGTGDVKATLKTKLMDSLYRYSAYSSENSNVEVLATGAGITVAKSGGNITFTIPANVRIISAKIRVENLSSIVCYLGTSDMANSSMADRWMPIVQAWREDTGVQLMGMTTSMSLTDHTKFTVNGLIGTTICQIRLSF